MSIRKDQSRPMLATPPSGSRTFFQSLKAAAVWLSEWFDSCANHYAAAGMYERLSRLSDAELGHRGLSRATLAQDLFRGCDRTCEADSASLETARRKEGRARTARRGQAVRARAGADNLDRRSA